VATVTFKRSCFLAIFTKLRAELLAFTDSTITTIMSTFIAIHNQLSDKKCFAEGKDAGLRDRVGGDPRGSMALYRLSPLPYQLS
jgi:hypothetical protein